MEEIWIATGNVGKLKEFERLFMSVDLKVKSTKDLPVFSAPPENGKTFLENSRIKAKSVRSIKNNSWVLADDSGLEVDGLGGLPGVHTARYAGNNASDRENYTKLVKMVDMRSPANRIAQFRCVLVLISPNGEEKVFEGILKGNISKNAKGTDGFGYDPIFIPDGLTKTLAEIPIAEKNKISHRAQAFRQLSEYLEQQIQTT